MTGKITFTVKTVPKCDEYLKIQWNNEKNVKIEDFIKIHKDATRTDIENCTIKYRGIEKTFRDFIKDYSDFADSMKFIDFNPFKIIINQQINASLYYMKKALDCMQNGRFFAMKSKLILDTNFNIPWS